jgi:NADH-quinone oxidoreductase subunit N
MITVAIIAALNSAVSLFYYARLFKAMYFEEAPEGAAPLKVPRVHALTLGLMAAPTTLLFLAWSPLSRFIDASLVQWLPAVAHAATAALQ